MTGERYHSPMPSLRILPRASLSAAFLAILLSAAPAEAGPYRFVRSGGSLACVTIDSYCASGYCMDSHCIEHGSMTTGETFTGCGQIGFPALCCTMGMDDECDTMDLDDGTTVPGTCVRVAGLTAADGTPVGVCDFADGTRWCDSSISTTRLIACLPPGLPPGGEPVDWRAGDCDGDSVSNGDELDLGSDPCTGPGGVDAGTADAGTADAGPMPRTDAGPRPRIDAGPGPGPTLTGVDIRGSGGCECRAAGGGDRALPGALTATLLALVLVRRRRR